VPENIDESESPAVIPFAAWLQDHQRGSTHAALTDGLHDLIEAVGRLQKEGKLVLTITAKPVGAFQVMVGEEVVLKEPKETRAPSIYFYDDAHNLVRDDPNAMQFEGLREVPAPAPLRTAKGNDGE